MEEFEESQGRCKVKVRKASWHEQQFSGAPVSELKVFVRLFLPLCHV